MKKMMVIPFLTAVAIIIFLSGCREKQWWEDSYSSEEAAQIDQLRVDLANMMEDKDSKIEELESQISDLQDEINDLQLAIIQK